MTSFSCAPAPPTASQASAAVSTRTIGLPGSQRAKKPGFLFVLALMVAPLLVVVTVGLLLSL